jgi:hypothetical protein
LIVKTMHYKSDYKLLKKKPLIDINTHISNTYINKYIHA